MGFLYQVKIYMEHFKAGEVSAARFGDADMNATTLNRTCKNVQILPVHGGYVVKYQRPIMEPVILQVFDNPAEANAAVVKNKGSWIDMVQY